MLCLVVDVAPWPRDARVNVIVVDARPALGGVGVHSCLFPEPAIHRHPTLWLVPWGKIFHSADRAGFVEDAVRRNEFVGVRDVVERGLDRVQRLRFQPRGNAVLDRRDRALLGEASAAFLASGANASGLFRVGPNVREIVLDEAHLLGRGQRLEPPHAPLERLAHRVGEWAKFRIRGSGALRAPFDVADEVTAPGFIEPRHERAVLLQSGSSPLAGARRAACLPPNCALRRAGEVVHRAGAENLLGSLQARSAFKRLHTFGAGQKDARSRVGEVACFVGAGQAAHWIADKCLGECTER